MLDSACFNSADVDSAGFDYVELDITLFLISLKPIKFTFITRSELLVFCGLLRMAVKMKVAVVLENAISFVKSWNVKVFGFTMMSEEGILGPEIY